MHANFFFPEILNDKRHLNRTPVKHFQCGQLILLLMRSPVNVAVGNFFSQKPSFLPRFRLRFKKYKLTLRAQRKDMIFQTCSYWTIHLQFFTVWLGQKQSSNQLQNCITSTDDQEAERHSLQEIFSLFLGEISVNRLSCVKDLKSRFSLTKSHKPL